MDSLEIIEILDGISDQLTELANNVIFDTGQKEMILQAEKRITQTVKELGAEQEWQREINEREHEAKESYGD